MKTIAYQDGDKIGYPCAVVGMPIDVYHGDPCIGPSISSSGLRTIWSDSPAHYWVHSPYNQNRIQNTPTDSFDIGKAAHHWLLGEDDFAARFAISPYEEFRTKEAREWKATTQQDGKVVLKASRMDEIKGMRDGLMRNPIVRAGILDGAIERSLFCLDEETGIWLRSRPDVVPNDSGDFADLKTTTSVNRDDIARSIAEFGYAMQVATLRMVCRALGIPFTSFSFVFVEKTPPYCARVVALKDHEIDRGEKQVRVALRSFAAGMKTGAWPGPDGEQDDVEWIESPQWAQNRADERLKQIAAMPALVGGASG